MKNIAQNILLEYIRDNNVSVQDEKEIKLAIKKLKQLNTSNSHCYFCFYQYKETCQSRDCEHFFISDDIKNCIFYRSKWKNIVLLYM